MRIGFRQQGYGICCSFLGCPASNLGSTDTNRGNRCLNRHRIRCGFGDLATDKREHALNKVGVESTFLGSGIENHFIDDHAAFFTKGKGRLVNKGDADSGTLARNQRIPLVNIISLGQLDFCPVHANGFDNAIGRFDPAYGFSRLCQFKGAAFQGKLSGGCRTGKNCCQLGVDDGPAFGHQIGRKINLEIINNEDLFAVGSRQHQVGTLTVKFCFQKPGFTGDRNGLTALRKNHLRNVRAF